MSSYDVWYPVADLGFVAGGGTKIFKGALKFQDCAKFSSLVNELLFVEYVK